MKPVLFLLLLFTFSRVNAQFALVEDKDGYVNVRGKAGTAYAVTGKALNGDIVYCMEQEGEWQLVDYYAGKEITSGYIHTSRLVMIDSLSNLKYSRYGKDSLIFRHPSLQVALYCRPFIPKNNKLEYKKTEGFNAIIKINRRTFWGTDGYMPSREYKKITCSWEGKPVIVPDSAFNDLFDPGLHMTQVAYDAPNVRWFITASNSDGGGSYEVIWMFERGVYKRRFIYHGFN